MPNTRNYQDLHEQVLARPGAAERLAELRKEPSLRSDDTS